MEVYVMGEREKKKSLPLLTGLAEGNLLNPPRLEDLSGGETSGGGRLEDGVDYVAAASAMQSLNRAVAVIRLAGIEVARVKLVRQLGHVPEVAACAHGHVDDAAGPDIDGASVKLLVGVLLGGDVGSGAADSGDHVGLSLPGVAEALAVAKVGDLEGATLGQQ